MEQIKQIKLPNGSTYEIVDAKAREDLAHLQENITIEEQDPTVPDWAKQPNKPTYKWDEITEKPEKLGGDAVEYVEQTLTEEQKAQARENIGAAPAYTYGTEDLTPGVSPLPTGTLHFVYE